MAADPAVTAVPEVDLAPLVHPAPPEDPEIQEHLEDPASPASHRRPCANRVPHHHASHAQAVNLVHQAHQDPTDNPVPQDSPENLADNHNPDHQDHLDPPDPMETPASPVHPANLELLPKAKDNRKDHPAHPEMPDHPVVPASPETMDSPVSQVAPDPKDHPVDPASPETTDSPVSLDKPAKPVELERRVSAPSIAPSMVVYSSRTEHAVARHFSTPSLRPVNDDDFEGGFKSHGFNLPPSFFVAFARLLGRNALFILLLSLCVLPLPSTPSSFLLSPKSDQKNCDPSLPPSLWVFLSKCYL